MLSRKNRVPRELFPFLLKNGKKYASAHIFLRVVRFSEEDRVLNTRFSFVVSAKVAKKAVDRNKLRRFGYEIVGKDVDNFKNGFVAVFFYTKDALKISKKELLNEINTLLKQAGLFKN
jgi:ribonuclease P protein component